MASQIHITITTKTVVFLFFIVIVINGFNNVFQFETSMNLRHELDRKIAIQQGGGPMISNEIPNAAYLRQRTVDGDAQAILSSNHIQNNNNNNNNRLAKAPGDDDDQEEQSEDKGDDAHAEERGDYKERRNSNGDMILHDQYTLQDQQDGKTDDRGDDDTEDNNADEGDDEKSDQNAGNDDGNLSENEDEQGDNANASDDDTEGDEHEKEDDKVDDDAQGSNAHVEGEEQGKRVNNGHNNAVQNEQDDEQDKDVATIAEDSSRDLPLSNATLMDAYDDVPAAPVEALVPERTPHEVGLEGMVDVPISPDVVSTVTAETTPAQSTSDEAQSATLGQQQGLHSLAEGPPTQETLAKTE